MKQSKEVFTEALELQKRRERAIIKIKYHLKKY